MRIESTHSTDSTVHVLTLNSIECDARAVGIDECVRVRPRVFTVRDGSATRRERGTALMFDAKLLVADTSDQKVKRSRASISSASGSVEIPKGGIFAIRVDDCYAVEINGKRRYVGDGDGSFDLVEKMGGE